MKNWMQKYEDNKEKTEEDTLQIQLTELIDLVDNAKYYEESKMIEALSKIIGLYEKQKEGGFDFNEKDILSNLMELASYEPAIACSDIPYSVIFDDPVLKKIKDT